METNDGSDGMIRSATRVFKLPEVKLATVVPEENVFTKENKAGYVEATLDAKEIN